MAQTLLQLVQQAANELSITEPSLIIGAQDEQSKQLLALAQREGKDFAALAVSGGGWQALHKEYTFTTAAVSTTGDTTAGSPIITNIGNTSGIVANTWVASLNGVSDYSYVVSVDSATQITLSTNVSETQTGVAIEFAQTAYSLPSDLDYFAYKTFWDNAYKWELIGAINAQEKQILRYGIVASGPRRKFYVRNNLMYLDPAPANGELIAYDYYSNAWCQSSGGVAQSRWASDADTYLLDEDCFVLGMKWRFLAAKGLEYAQEKNDYLVECQRVMSRDGGGARDLPIAGGTYGARFLDDNNIPDGNWS